MRVLGLFGSARVSPSLVLLLLSNWAIAADVVHEVTVGVEGSFFVPQTTSAGLGDIVQFIAAGDAHTITQSSFDAPCTRLSGGFDSGILGRGANFSRPTPFWSLTITNVSQPIWFFCELTIPVSHCTSGMLGAINPPSQAAYDQFVAKAKTLSTTTKPSPTFLPSGQGAIGGPISTASLPLSSLFSSLSITPTSLGDTLPSSTESRLPGSTGTTIAAHSGPNKGLIAGCVVAGTILIIILLALAFYCGRRRRGAPKSWSWRISGAPLAGPAAVPQAVGEPYPKYPYAHHQQVSPGSMSVLPGTPTMVSSRGYDREHGHGQETPSHGGTLASFEGHQPPIQHAQRDRDRKSPPPVHVRPLPHVPSSGQLSPNTNNTASQHSQGVDMNALALEVASVLLAGKVNTNLSGSSQQRGHAEASTSDAGSSRWYDRDRDTQDDNDMTRATSVAPPYSSGG
ncbi:hypothetical protein MKEN_01139100 [Mycena kentingensis (nom. inval.)]|nr:hypothetical protein MKEN_01139100 [Mycena kentingensis (nom. inval.)]